MSDIVSDPWVTDSCEDVVQMMLEGLCSKSMRYMMMRQAIGRGRKGALHYHHDSLVGFVHGLIHSLWMLGVRADLLKFGEVPYRSFFFDTKRWDYLLEDPAGRPIIRIETKCLTGYGQVRPRSKTFSWDNPSILGTLYDHRLSDQTCFAGLVMVHRLRQKQTAAKKPEWSAIWSRKRHAKLEHFLLKLEATGLANRMVFIEEDNGIVSQPLPKYTLANLLAGVRDEIFKHPELLRPPLRLGGNESA